MPSGLALRTGITRTRLNIAAPADLLHDFSRNQYAATYNGSEITSSQLPSGIWVKYYPQGSNDDYVSYAGTIGENWHIKAFEIWYCPIAEKSEPAAQQDIIFNKSTTNVHGWIRRNVGSPNTMGINFSDSGGSNSTVSYNIPDYTAWYHLFGLIIASGQVRSIINGEIEGTGGGILVDNHGNGAAVSGAPVRIGGGIVNRYDTAMSCGAILYTGEIDTGEDDYWAELAYDSFHKNKHLFGY